MAEDVASRVYVDLCDQTTVVLSGIVEQEMQRAPGTRNGAGRSRTVPPIDKVVY